MLEQYRALHNYFWWLSGSREVAADLTQETFACVWKSLPSYQGRAPLTVWLYGIASRVWRQHLRHRPAVRFAGLRLGETAPDPSPGPEELATQASVRGRLEGALRRLPDAYRQVIILRYFQGMSHSQIAAAVGSNVALAKWRLREGLRRLARMLGPMEEFWVPLSPGASTEWGEEEEVGASELACGKAPAVAD